MAAFAGNPYDRLVVDLAYVDMAQRAAAAGCAAIFINTFADYGIDAMRSAVAVPVVGAGESGMTLAANGGRRFSIVTVWPPSMKFLHDERTRTVAAGAACLMVRHVSAEDELQRLATEHGVQQRMARREEAIIDQIVRECERSIREDGAQRSSWAAHAWRQSARRSRHGSKSRSLKAREPAIWPPWQRPGGRWLLSADRALRAQR